MVEQVVHTEIVASLLRACRASFYFASRALAQAASPAATVDILLVLHSDRVLSYEKIPSGNLYPALVTADGQKWGPGGHSPMPLHWGAIGDATTDDHAALQAMFNFMVAASANMPDSYAAGSTWSVNGAGKKYATSKPVIIGNVGTGVGMLYFANVDDLHLKAIQGAYNWSTILNSEVPSSVLTIAYQFNQNASDSLTGVYKVSFNRVTIDCNFLTGGIYIQNTTQLSFRDCGVDFIGKNRSGFETSIGSAAYNPRNFRTVNGALLIENMNIQGYVEEAPKFGGGQVYPTGEDQVTMNTVAFKIMTNDARYHQIICSRVTRAMHVDYCGAVQFSDIHPWSREVYIGPVTNNLMFSNCYFDYTRVILDAGTIGNWNHYFNACHWILGAADRGLELRTQVANTTGAGLILNGCRFKGDGNDLDIECTQSGSGSWVGVLDRRYQLVGCQFAVNSSPEAYFKAGRNFSIAAADGRSYFSRDEDGYGRTEIAGNSVSVGLDRAVGGSAGLYMQWQGGPGLSTNGGVSMDAAGNMALDNNYTDGDIVFGVTSNPGASRIKADGSMQAYGLSGVNAAAAGLKVGRVGDAGSRSINAGGTINTSGADYAEYHKLIEPLWGTVPKGAILGFNANGVLTDRYDDVVARFVIKSTEPNLVGADNWGTEASLVEKFGIEPIGQEPVVREVAEPTLKRSYKLIEPLREQFPDATAYESAAVAWQAAVETADDVWQAFEADRQAALEAYREARAAYGARQVALLDAYEQERVKYDRIAKCGYVPVNIAVTASDIGKYLVPVKSESGGITAVPMAEHEMSLVQYIRSIGCVIGLAADGRPFVEVKTG
jgi:hypothetical protein